MADFRDFRLSDNIEDRRRTPFVPTPGVFGDGVSLPNVFDNGLLTGLSPQDFVQIGATPLGRALGIDNLSQVSPSLPGASGIYKPLGAMGSVTDSIVRAESGGNPNATNPNSSATGAGQFINSTWLDTIKAARPDLAQGKSDAELLALRSDPALSREMTEAYANQNGAILSKNGLPVTPGTTYLAHFAGPQGAVSVLQADPGAPVSSVLSPDAVRANPFLRNMTVGDLRAWADRKMGGAQPAQATPAAPSSPPLQLAQPTGPLQLAPQAPPIFPRAMPQAQPQQQAQPEQAGDIFGQMQSMGQPPPIFFPQRRSPDLSKLRSALGQAGGFSFPRRG